MDTKEIIVMVGLPASGKSTHRDKMIAESGVDYVIVSSDDEIERFALEEGSNYTEAFDKYVGRATAIAKKKFRDAVKEGKHIIWDQTNLTPKKRRSILKDVGEDYRKVAVVFELTDDELDRRINKRKSETGKDIPAHVMKSMAKSYLPPTKEEGFDNIIFVNN